MRPIAVHFCPLPENAPLARCGSTASRSASARTTATLLPPISNCSGHVPAGHGPLDAPAGAVDPVKVSARHRGVAEQRPGQVAAVPHTRLSTPSGRPASASARTKWAADSGTSSLHFHTTVLPWASAGPIFQAGSSIG